MLFRKKMILAKLETTYGTDPTPTGSANSILTHDLDLKTFQGNKAALNYDRPYLGADKQIYTGPYSMLTFGVDLAGAGTAGTAPAYGPLLRACGFAEIINAAEVTGTATGGATGTITLAASSSSDNDEYNGLLITIASGLGAGQTRRVKDYVGSSKTVTVDTDWDTPPDNTSVYSMPAQVVYAPVSGGFESAHVYFYIDDELHKLSGARGTVSVDCSKEAMPQFKFSFTGLRVPAAAGTNPTPDFSGFVEPLPVNDTNTPDLVIHGFSAKTESVSFDIANSVVYRNVVNGENVIITDRDPKMSITIEKPDIGDKNFDALIASHAAAPVYIIHGTAAGNIARIDASRVQLMDPTFADSDGLATQSMNGALLPSDAGDDELFVTAM